MRRRHYENGSECGHFDGGRHGSNLLGRCYHGSAVGTARLLGRNALIMAPTVPQTRALRSILASRLTQGLQREALLQPFLFNSYFLVP